MPATPKARKRGGLHRRRIIERPRLLALLNGSPARVRTLIAPAGYGKTTLAEQWVGQEGRRHAWFTARPSSTDVAALALGLARAATAIVPDCDVRLREHLRALPAPAEHVDVLAELLAEDLADWPEDTWLVLDDYHELTSTNEAETFVELAAAAPIQLLIASRQRPSWITARKILYGEVLELNQTELAMDGHEAAEVLTERNAASASGLVALADGWPAVIGLASVSTAEIEEPGAVPEGLYEFFAEEVFSSLPNEVQAGVTTLAIAPVMDRPLAVRLLGGSCDRVCATALDVGILVERGVHLDIHPLARAFLVNRLEQLGVSADSKSVETCLVHFLERRDWDAAFDLIVRRGHPHQVDRLLDSALDDMLDTARLSTIESWCEHAGRASFKSAIVSLARAEVALRHSRLGEAQAHAEAAAAMPSGARVRALLTAGRAAHLASLDIEALDLYRQAEAAATNDGPRREARWGQALCYADLEMPEAISVLEELAAGVHDAREVVRAASHHLVAKVASGSIELAAADRAAQLLPVVEDPLVESGFLSIYSCALAGNARYREARDTAAALLTIAQRYRLDFALPYAHYSSGIGDAGLRNWDAAEQTLYKGLVEARNRPNAHAEKGCFAALCRVLAQRGRLDAALALVREDSLRLSAPVPAATHAEFVASQALVLALLDQLDEARSLVESIRGRSRAVDGVALIAAVEAISALKRDRTERIDCVVAFAEQVSSLGALDVLVTTYRAAPEILAILLRSSMSSRVEELVRRVGDEDLAQAVGCPVALDTGAAALTPREREVHELLKQGITNREIARLLVITEATAKRHVHHIFDKLGVRSRRTIAMQAALERGLQATQATSAIDDTGVGTGS